MRKHARICLDLLLATVLAALPMVARAVPEPLELSEAVSLASSLGGLEEYPDANSITGLDHTYIEFDEAGAYEQSNHTFVKILTEEGRDDNGSVSITYHRRYGSVDITMARVIKADGTEIVVEEDLITEGTPPEISAMNIFEEDFRQISVVFPGLEVGDAIEHIIHQSYKPLIDNGFNGIYFLQHTEPIVESRVTIVGPSSLPLVHVVKNGEADYEETADGDRTVHTWTTRGMPKIERELAMAPPRQIAARLIVSTMHTWEETSRYVWKLVDEKCVVDESIVSLVAEITDGLTSTEDKIRAIHYWILENVRYLGIAMDRGAFLEPHFASYTLEKEYGICRDKATLMITMLSEIGVPAWMVVINPSHRMDTEIPTIYFEHGIVAIEGPDGDYLYIDPTIEGTREVYAGNVGDRYLLVGTEEGEDIRQAAHVPATANSGDIMDHAVLADDGSIEGNVTITGNGFYELILRTVSKSVGPQQFEMMAEKMVQNIYPGAELKSFSVTDADDLYEPTAIELSYYIDDYALDAAPYTLFKVPAATGSFELLSDFLFGRMVGLPERKYPVALGVTLGVDEKAEVALPAGFIVENLPDAVDFEAGAISLSMTYEYVPPEGGGVGFIRYNRKFGLDAFEISPADYLNLKEAVRLAARSEKGEVILKREED
jgi:transglutaminase-like putative cysteine protease